jgi:hypothetical protein
MLLTGNAPTAAGDLLVKQPLQVSTGKGAATTEVWRTRMEWFDLQMQQRRDFIRQQAAEGRRKLRVPPIVCWPNSFFHSDLSPYPDHWANAEMSKFFGVEMIVCVPGQGFAAQ